MAAKRRRGLGKGLEALIPSGGSVPGLKKVNIDAIVPNPFQPRSGFDEEALKELAASIKEVGLIQPLLVQEATESEDSSKPKRYRLIAGERRWRAARMAGLQHVDVLVKDATPREMLELALVENIQRADLNPVEEAHAYSQLAEEFDLTHERIAQRVGRSRVSVTNTLRLLQLPQEVKEALLKDELSEGHARALLMLDSKEERLQALQQVLKGDLSVRQTEELARRMGSSKETARSRERTRSPQTEALEGEFRNALGTKVDLHRSSKGGRLVIHFYSEEELQALYERIVED